MVIAARDKYGEDIAVTRGMGEDGNEGETEGKIAALYRESSFHRGGQIEDDSRKKEDTYVDLGDGPRLIRN